MTEAFARDLMAEQATHALCPHCGYDIVPDRPIILGELAIDPRFHIATWRGEPVKLTTNDFIILYSLVKAYPWFVRREALRERAGSEADNPNYVSVYLYRLRKKLPGCVIEAIRGVGYRWSVPIYNTRGERG